MAVKALPSGEGSAPVPARAVIFRKGDVTLVNDQPKAKIMRPVHRILEFGTRCASRPAIIAVHLSECLAQRVANDPSQVGFNLALVHTSDTSNPC